MDLRSVQEYAQAMLQRYTTATKQERTALLTEFCTVTGYHRKAAIRRLRLPVAPSQGKRGRRPTYPSAVVQAMEELWEASGRLCSKRLVGVAADLLAALERHGELRFDPAVREAVLAMSPATIDRRLAPLRRGVARRPYGQSASAAALKALVPVRTFGDWADAQPGDCQTDLVLHCGDTTEGTYLATLMVVDPASGWQDFDALLNKGYLYVRGGLQFARKRLPFRLRKLHTDNGGEFLNHPLQEYCRAEGIVTSRGRPYRKNDQAYVEQRNGSVVRHWVGYDRYASPAALQVLRRLYAALRPYVNFFHPVQRLTSKHREGSTVHKRYDAPRTPYQRLLSSGTLTADQERRLCADYEAQNPAALLREIAVCQELLLKHIDHSTQRRLGNTISEATTTGG